jgi:hypothetical protein
MPLVQGKSDEAVSENIRRETRAGKSQRQAIAIAMRTAGRPKKTAAELVTEIASNPAKLAAFEAVKAALFGKEAGVADLFKRMAGPAAGGAMLGAGAGALSAKMQDRDVGRGALAGGLGGGALGALGGAMAPGMAGRGSAYAQAATSGLDPNTFKGMASKMLEGAGMATGVGVAGLAGNALLGSVDTRESRDKELGKFEAQQEIKSKQLLALEPQHNAAFTAAKTDDVIAKAETSLVHSSYATMKRFAPNLAADPNAVRSFLREAVIYGNGPSYATLKNLADAEKSVVGAGGVGR